MGGRRETEASKIRDTYIHTQHPGIQEAGVEPRCLGVGRVESRSLGFERHRTQVSRNGREGKHETQTSGSWGRGGEKVVEPRCPRPGGHRTKASGTLRGIQELGVWRKPRQLGAYHAG